jgi:hypothetical protein
LTKGKLGYILGDFGCYWAILSQQFLVTLVPGITIGVTRLGENSPNE